jgi:hypothetical protein
MIDAFIIHIETCLNSNDMNHLLTLSYKIFGIFIQRSINDNGCLTFDEYQCLFN